jgi:hypothetical protein
MNDETYLERDPDDAFDLVLRAELHWEAPPELSARLLALVPGGLIAMPAAIVKAQPKLWVRVLMLVLTVAALGLSFAIASLVYGALASDLGVSGWWEQAQAWPTIATGWLFDNVPGTSVVVSLLGSVRDQLHWLLAAVVLWMALDGWNPSFVQKRATS